MEVLGWIVILILGLVFVAVIAWLGVLWITSRMGKSMTEVFRTGVSREEIEEIKREMSQLRESIEDLKHRSRR
jgi:pilus assembly protein TadC